MDSTVLTPFSAEEAKPYEFRALGAPDLFLMFTIIGKIGINEFLPGMNKDVLLKLADLITEKDSSDTDRIYMAGALTGVLDIAGVIFGNLHKCETEIYKLLAQTSNMTVDEIKAPGNALLFVQMIADFLKKDEFPAFFKVASSLFSKK